jgi:hypothetical protein
MKIGEMDGVAPEDVAEDVIESTVDEIVAMEWIMFDAVENEGGRAACQDDLQSFYIQRSAQFFAWPLELLESYHKDLIEAGDNGINLLANKYAYIMAYTYPDEYEKIKDELPELDEEKKILMAEIRDVLVMWHRQAAEDYPIFSARGRLSLATDARESRDPSVQAYSTGELATYSNETLKIYHRYVNELLGKDLNLALMTFENLAISYGYDSLDEAEAAISKV